MFFKKDKEEMIKNVEEFFKKENEKLYNKDTTQNISVLIGTIILVGALGVGMFSIPIGMGIGFVMNYYNTKKISKEIDKNNISKQEIINLINKENDFTNFENDFLKTPLGVVLKSNLILIFSKNELERIKIINKISLEDPYTQLLNDKDLFEKFSEIIEEIASIYSSKPKIKVNSSIKDLIDLNLKIKKENSLKEFEFKEQQLKKIQNIEINETLKDDEIIVDRINLNNKHKV